MMIPGFISLPFVGLLPPVGSFSIVPWYFWGCMVSKETVPFGSLEIRIATERFAEAESCKKKLNLLKNANFL